MITYNYRKAKLIMARAEVVAAFVLFGYNPYYTDIVNESDKFETTDYSVLYFEFIYSIVEIIISDIDVIQSGDATTLSTSSEPVILRVKELITTLIPSLLGESTKVSYLVVQIIYAYKYVTVRTFFQDNYHKFLPEYFLNELESAEKRTLLLKSFMHEFDKLAEMIEYAAENYDITQVQNEFMYYLGEMIGNTRDEYLTDEWFREFSKYIIEIYRRKGSLYSFELYFNLLGFSIELTEFWFDKRFFNINYAEPADKRFTDKTKFTYYLTTQRPTEFIPPGLGPTDYVLEEDFVAPQNLMYFDYLYSTVLTPTQRYKLFLPVNNNLLPSDANYGYGFIYFKTNFVTYEITKERTSIYTAQDISNGEMLKKYIDFLTPIFVKHDIIFNFRPFEDVWKFLLLDNTPTEKRTYNFGLETYQEAVNNGDLLKGFTKDIETADTKEITKESFLSIFNTVRDAIVNSYSYETMRVRFKETFDKILSKEFIDSSILTLKDNSIELTSNALSELINVYFNETLSESKSYSRSETETMLANFLQTVEKNNIKTSIEKSMLNFKETPIELVNNALSELINIYFSETSAEIKTQVRTEIEQILGTFFESKYVSTSKEETEKMIGSFFESKYVSISKEETEKMLGTFSENVELPQNTFSFVNDEFLFGAETFNILTTFEEWLVDGDGFTYYNGEVNSVILKDKFAFKLNTVKTPPFIYV